MVAGGAEMVAAPMRDARRVLAIDIETTGIRPYDRVITLAAILLIDGEFTSDAYHLIFDPRMDNEPEAAQVHGWDDWTLRFQDLFADLAPAVHQILSDCDLLVAHNAEFDTYYLNRELRKAGFSQITHPICCTLQLARDAWPGQRASLDACIKRIGLSRTQSRHSAFEDAFLAGNVYRYFIGRTSYRRLDTCPIPTNLCPALPRPEGLLPRRSPKRRRIPLPKNTLGTIPSRN